MDTVQINVTQKFPSLDPLQHISVRVHMWNNVGPDDIRRRAFPTPDKSF